MKKHSRLSLPFWTLTLLVFIAIGLAFGLLGVAQPASSASLTPQQAVQLAWKIAGDSGVYRYRSVIQQTTIPSPSVSNAGRAPQAAHFGIEGTVNLLADQLELTLWRDGSFKPGSGVEMRVEQGKAYQRVNTTAGPGDWKEIDDFSENFAPGSDPLGFLAAAKNLRLEETSNYLLDLPGSSDSLQYTRYSFDFDGPSLGDYMRQKLQQQLTEQGELPPQLSLDVPEMYRHMTGSGQVWISSDGLPARLSVDLTLVQPQTGQRVQVQVQNDYFGFDHQRIQQSSVSWSEKPAAWVQVHLLRPGQIPAWLVPLAWVSLIVLFGLVLIVYSRRRHLYIVVAGLLLAALIAGPLMQTRQVYAFYERQAQQTVNQQALQQQNEKLQQAQDAVYTKTWDAHQNPQTAAGTRPDLTKLNRTIQSMATTAATDTDQDGLSDADETAWLSCAYPGAAYCTGVTDTTDSDGDGLKDGVEVNTLGALPDQWDSDGDTISDTLEVQGFTYNGTTWYLNPNDTDTNGDGVLDSVECPQWSDTSSDYNPAAICPDTDRDGTPDAFDFDNDDDGVFDGDDLSPLTKSMVTYSNNQPLQFSISDFEINHPMLVKLQLRPTNSKHLIYPMRILDWPTDDTDGQIVRYQDTTFSSTTNSDLQSSDTNADNGDVRLIPMLEVTVPYQENHYGGLPVKDAYQGVNRSATDAVDTWLDSDETDPYSMVVRDTDDGSHDLLVYVPLSTVSNSNGDAPEALGASLVYWPSQSTWGNAHQYRVVWMVQMITDECIDPSADEATCERQDTASIINVYYDETWTLTGLSVSEEHGLDAAVVYEDPTLDTNLTQDDDLWSLSWNLSNTFITGRDCDSTDAGGACVGDGQRDVTLANLASKIAAWSDNSSDLTVSSYGAYAHQDYITTLMMTETVNLLDTYFTSYAGSTNPTFMVLRENTARSLNLDDSDANLSGSDVTMNLNPSHVAQALSTSMSWSSYQYVDGAWTNMAPSDYLTAFTTQLKDEDSFFQPEDSSTDSEDIADGKLIWAQMYYVAMYNGLVGMPEWDGSVTWTPTTHEVSTAVYTSAWEDVTFSGVGWAGYFFAYGFLQGIQSTASTMTVFQRIKYAFTTNINQLGSQYLGWSKTRLAGMPIFGLGFALTAIGATFFMIGYFTDNQDILKAGEVFLNLSGVVFQAAWTAGMMSALYQLHTTVGLANAYKVGTLSNLSYSYRSIGVVTLIISMVVSWGLFAYQILAGGTKWGSEAANVMLALTVGQTIVMIILFVIELIPIAGPLIVGLILLVDTVLNLFGVRGAQERVSQAIGSSLYDADEIISNLNDSGRLNLDITGLALADSQAGFTAQNSVAITATVNNTIRINNGNTYDEETMGRRATFKYFLQKAPTDQDSSLALDQMTDDWTVTQLGSSIGSLGGKWELMTTQTPAITAISLNIVGTGINRTFTASGFPSNDSGRLYLTEAYAIPYEICWQIFADIGEFNCKTKTVTGSSHIYLGQDFALDILPNSLNDFVALNWNSGGSLAFPHQKDQDGDTLRSIADGGADPDDTQADSDGDGLNDDYEITYGLDAQDADADGDGLNDWEEVYYGTNPSLADTDDDGLNDALEVKAGWLIAYTTSSGSTAYTRVWSDPNLADYDDDKLTDLQENIYGTNPNVNTDASVVNNLVSFSGLQVNEDTAPQLLLRFEENKGATTFSDSSGYDHNATCTNCPAQTDDGRYGGAFKFYNNVVVVPNINLANTSFTLGAWAQKGGMIDSLMSYGAGEYGTGTIDMGFLLSGNFRCAAANGSVMVSQPGSGWHHWACVFDDAQNTLTVYKDGVQAGQSSATGSINTNGNVYLGHNLNDHAGYLRNGILDEVAVFDYALSAAQVTDLYQGAYNTNDGLVQPGQELTYQATITNTSTNTALDGFLQGASVYDTPELAAPTLASGFETADRYTVFANTSGESNTATCLDAAGACPNFHTSGQYGNGALFDGSDDFISLPTLGIERFNRYTLGEYHSLAFWIKPTGLPAAGTFDYLLDSDRSDAGALDVYVDSNGQVTFAIQGADASRYCTTTCQDNWPFDVHTSSAHLSAGAWTHVAFTFNGEARYSTVYINGAADSTLFYNSVDDVIDGPGRLGNSAAGNQALNGVLDEFIVYNGEFLNTTNVNTVMNGTYFIDVTSIATGAAVVPSFGLEFSSNTENIAYVNQVTGATTLRCASITDCPALTTGVFDKGLSFDGSDYLVADSESDYDFNQMSMAAWVKVDAFTQNWQAIITKGDTAWQLQRYGSSDKVAFSTNGLSNVDLASAASINDGEWHHVAAVYDGLKKYIYIDGRLDASVDVTGQLATNDDNVWIGNNAQSTGRAFLGALDEVVILPAALSADAVKLLMNSTYPAIALNDDFVPFQAAASASTTVSGAAQVNAKGTTSTHRFNETVEAALGSSITIPVVDDNTADLVVYMPFDDLPGVTQFDNLMDSANPGYDGRCSSNDCPQAGLRGMVDRAAYFDGVDDSLSMTYLNNATTDTSLSLAAWVKADQGTILHLRSTQDTEGVELDFNRFLVVVKDSSYLYYSLPLSLPANEWTYVVATVSLNRTGTSTATVYVNGVQNSSQTITFGSSSSLDTHLPTIGSNIDGSDYLHGYVDDVRVYKKALTATEVQTLYQNSAPRLHFEFDEESDATQYADSSSTGATGAPYRETCSDLTLETVTLSAYRADAQNVSISVDGENRYYDTITNTLASSSLNLTAPLCGQQTLSVDVLDTVGAAMHLGSVSLSASSTGSASQSFTAGGNTLDLAWAIGNPYQVVNPAPGTDGQIGNTAYFNGAGYIQVADASSVASLTHDFTLLGWINPENLSGEQWLLTTGRAGSASDGYGFGLADTSLTFEPFGSQSFVADSANLDTDSWQHVAVVFNASNTVSFYVNGALVNSFSASTAASANSDDPLYIGAIALNAGLSGYYTGQIDELAVFSRSMSQAELQSIYQREARWYRDQGTTALKVDDDQPVVSLLTNEEYHRNEYIQLVVSAEDAGTSVAYMDFGLKKPGDTIFTWSDAPQCADRAQTWCPSFDPSSLNGAGDYSVQFRAVDLVGHITTSAAYTIHVDNTAPVVSSAYHTAWMNATADSEDDQKWTVPLSGSIVDAGVGVYTSTVTVSLSDSAGNPVNNAQSAAVSGSTWSVDYSITGLAPSGLYTVTVTAEDKLGNSASTPVGTFYLDERAPQVAAETWAQPTSGITNTTTFSGLVSEQAPGGGAAAWYPMEDGSSSETLSVHDYSGESRDAACENDSFCPLTVTGVFGQGLSFRNSALVATVPLTDTSFTFSLWSNAVPRVPYSSYSLFLSQGSMAAGSGLAFGYDQGYSMICGFWGDQVRVGPYSSTSDGWHHWACAYDHAARQLSLYRDGVLLGIHTVTTNYDPADLTLKLGGAFDTGDMLSGSLDEVAIYRRSLSAGEISMLAQQSVSGVQSVQYALAPYTFSDGESSPTWKDGVLSTPNATLSTWSVTPDLTNLEGYYELRMRATDALGNTGEAGTIWRNVIDTRAPRISAAATYFGLGEAARTVYTANISDKFLDTATLVQPCASSDIAYTYNADTGLVEGMSLRCAVSGHQSAPVTFKVCDYAGHCTTATVVPQSPATFEGILITAPDGDLNTTGAVNVQGIAYAAGIDEITLQASDGTHSQTLGSFSPGGVTYTPWSVEWLPTWAGVYTLTAEMRSGTDTYRDQIAIRAPERCWANVDSTATQIGSYSAIAVQAAIDSARAGDTVKVAGTCYGVQERQGLQQTAYITQSLTLHGGYTTSNWDTSSNAATYLNAGDDGRVAYIGSEASVTISHLNLMGGSADQGGAIYNLGTLTLANSAVFSSTATDSGAGLFNLGSAALINSTLSGNQAANYGGAIANSGSLSLTHTTLANNAAGVAGGAYSNSGDLSLRNSLVAGNTAATSEADCANDGGVQTSLGYTLVGAGTGCPFSASDIQVTPAEVFSAVIGPLAENDVEPWSHALLTGSPALDAIPNGVSGCGSLYTTDQRGWPRPENGACDLGALEAAYEPLTLTITGPNGGSLSIAPLGMDCDSSCSAEILRNTPITLTVSLTAGYSFEGWGGACAAFGKDLTCTISMDAAKSVTAAFAAGQCFTEYTGDNVWDFASTDARALRQAIDAAVSGDTVKVAGTCAGVSTQNGTQQVALIDKELTIQGGYTVTDWDTYDPAAHPTVIDAQSSGIGLYATVNTTLAGLWVTGGSASTGNGAGIRAMSALTLTDVTIAHNTLAGNSNLLGGGVYVQGAAVWKNVSVDGNTAQSWQARGGGAYFYGSASLSNVTFSSNTASDRLTNDYSSAAGGAYFRGTAVLTDTQFTGNRANNGNGGAYFEGSATLNGITFSANQTARGDCGGACFSGATVLVDGLFQQNVAGGSAKGGGAFFGSPATIGDTRFISNTFSSNGSGGGLYANAAITLTRVALSGNEALNGGGAYFNAFATLESSTLSSNTANGGYGGGASFYNGFQVSKSIFQLNTAKDGGAVYVFNQSSYQGAVQNSLFAGNTSASAHGLDVYYDSPPPSALLSLYHNTFVYGTATGGSAVYGAAGVNNVLTVKNSILSGYPIAFESTGSSFIEDANLFSGVTTPTSGPITSLGHSISGEAAFVDAAADNYHITAASDAVDLSPNVGVSDDMDGDLRPLGLGYDAGYDEIGLSLVNSSPASINQNVIFTATLVGDSGYSYTWDFGDGTVLNNQPASVSHAYTTADIYTAWVTATHGTDTLGQISPVTVTAAISLTFSGAGEGWVEDSLGSACSTDCVLVYANPTVTLTAYAPNDSTFTGWSGDCSGTGACVLTMNQVHHVTANYIETYYLLNVYRNWGQGTVTSSPASIDCGSTCSADLDYGTTITLTATPDPGYTFLYWAGACASAGTSPSCTVSMTAARNVQAYFGYTQVTLTVARPTDGTVSGGNISCGYNATRCTATYDYGSVVTLTAYPRNVSKAFIAWGGDCSGSATCVLTMTSNKSVTATFGTATYTLTTHVAGSGSGTVTSSPAYLNCSSSDGTCSNAIPYFTYLTLDATPAAGSTFTGWGGECAGYADGPTCGLWMLSTPKTISATFEIQTLNVQVSNSGNGNGQITAVTSLGSLLDCGSTCSGTVQYGTVITFTATPQDSALETMLGWSNPVCPGTDPCVLTVTENTNLSARIEAYACFAETTGDNVTDYLSADASALRQAIASANSGGIVKVAGTCAGTANENGSDQVAFLDKPLTLLGGYTRYDWFSADPAAHLTILDAEGNGRALYATLPVTLTNIILQNGSTAGSGAGAFFFDAATITGGAFLNNQAGAYQMGGGAYFQGQATISGTQFTNNTFAAYRIGYSDICGSGGACGGGLYAAAAITVTNAAFSDNRANFGGGAFLSTDAAITNSTFSQNYARQGGGLSSYDLPRWDNVGTVSITGSTFSGNYASRDFAGADLHGTTIISATNFIQNDGGGLRTVGSTNVYHSGFYTNTVSGGAVFLYGANVSDSIFSGNQSTATGGGAFFGDASSIQSSVFRGNSARNGGGASVRQRMTISDTLFADNTATDNGGGITFSLYGSVDLVDSIFHGNTAGAKGGAFYTFDSGEVDPGTTVTAINTLLDNNAAPAGAGIYVYSYQWENSVPVTLQHLTFANDTLQNSSAVVNDGSFVSITNTLVSGYATALVNLPNDFPDSRVSEDYNLFSGVTQIYNGAITPGAHSLSGAALFDSDYRLLPGSAGLNAGMSGLNVYTDFEGDPRPQGGGYDIGYDEEPYTAGLTLTHDALMLVDRASTLTATLTNADNFTLTWNFGDGMVVNDPTRVMTHTYATGSYTAIVTATNSVTTLVASQSFVVGQPLSIQVTGNGQGTVTDGGALSCSGNCLAGYDHGTQVTLQATPGSGSSFAGWSGACSGAGVCTVSMDTARSVSAQFTRNQYTLTIHQTGSGSGVVSGGSSPCSGSTCVISLDYGTVVTLTATPNPGSAFTGWSGSCAGVGACVVSMDENKEVSAAYTLNRYTLTVVKTGAGSGVVASAPGSEIDCGVSCSANLAYGTVITLTATPTLGWAFAGWEGVCAPAGFGECVLTITEPLTATAKFEDYRCFVETTGDNITDFASTYADALRAAIAASNPGDVLKVAGTCAGGIPQSGATQVAYITKTLTLSGGYSPTDWFTSNPTLYPTILDAQGSGRVIRSAAALVLENLRLTGGGQVSDGAGIYSAQPLTLHNVSLVENHSTHLGGGLYATNRTMIGQSTFESNTADLEGGGAVLYGITIMTDTVFTQNSSSNSGGASLLNLATLNGVTFSHNTATENTGGAYFGNTISLSRVTFNNNQAGGWAGGALFDGQSTLSDVTFIENTSGGDGGGAFFLAHSTWTGVRFEHNVSGQNGGGAISYSALDVDRSVFTENSAQTAGGLYFDALADGAGTLINTLFSGNTASNTHGTELYDASPYDLALRYLTIASPASISGSSVYLLDGSLSITNTIIANHSIGLENYDGTLSENYNLFDAMTTPYSGTISSGPGSFIGSAAFNDTLTYTLTGSSDAIDAGINAGVDYDYFGSSRPRGHGYDIGYQETGFASYYVITPTAGAGGTISPSTPQTATFGSSLTFTFAPDTQYHIQDVSVDGVSQGAVDHFTFSNIAADHSLHVSFALNTYTITPTAGAGGTISPGTPQTVSSGDSITFTIATNAGYHIQDVLLDDLSVGAVNSYTFDNVTADHTIQATFSEDSFTITPTAGAGGTISPGVPQTVRFGDTITFTIAANPGYHIQDVLVDGISVGAVGSYAFTDVRANHTITVTFAIDGYKIYLPLIIRTNNR